MKNVSIALCKISGACGCQRRIVSEGLSICATSGDVFDCDMKLVLPIRQDQPAPAVPVVGVYGEDDPNAEQD